MTNDGLFAMTENSKSDTPEQVTAKKVSELLQKKSGYEVKQEWRADQWHFRFTKTVRDSFVMYVAHDVIEDYDPDAILTLLEELHWESVVQQHKGKDTPCLNKGGFSFLPSPK